MKRRTIGLSLLMIGLVVGLLGIGSWAVFNDTETTEGNVLGSGALDLEIGEGSALPVELLDLKPSEWHYVRVLLHNAGNNPGVLDLHFADIVDTDIERTPPEVAADPDNLFNDISNWIDVDWCIDFGEGEPDEEQDCDGTIIGKLGDLESKVTDLGLELGPSEVAELWLSFHLDRGAGNEYQKDQTTFDIEFTLHQVGQPAGATTIRLENKCNPNEQDCSELGLGDWDPIVDDLYGSATYWVGSDLHVVVRAHGLAPETWHQFTLNGPGVCTDTDDQLASGVQKYSGMFESGFWNTGPALDNTCDPTEAGEGIYNPAYLKSDASGNLSGHITIGVDGPDETEGDDVSGTYPTLPSGEYSDVKPMIKEIQPTEAFPPPPWDPGTYTVVLMEMATMDFNLP